MKLTKMIMVVLTAMLIAVPAFAGNCPEYDAVGCDSMNYFALNAYVPLGMVSDNNIGDLGGFFAPINAYSAFPLDEEEVWGEKFEQTAGMLSNDHCFPGYMSAMTPVWTEATYKWWIILQMQPESDINVNIYDCVLKHNLTNIWTDAQQTGRYRTYYGEPIFDPNANPTITVRAVKGPFNAFKAFIMDARKLPGLEDVALKNVRYTSKALFDEGIVMVMPKTGNVNTSGENMKTLKQGDQIRVTISIPGTNSCDVRYGTDSVILKYIGVVGNYMYDEYCGGVL
ncbi:MAG: hypothetical protein BA873_16185 [Desulfobulbaceae bacterium C00003063]|nr:MAG: hypothetical protein BA873_16185 [Desulfobulbaceae bacterium C00003063]